MVPAHLDLFYLELKFLGVVRVPLQLLNLGGEAARYRTLVGDRAQQFGHRLFLYLQSVDKEPYLYKRVAPLGV